jgi:hypothetical protein
MSTDKIREDLRSARETAARVLGKRPATTPEELDQCQQILDEVITFIEQWPALGPEKLRHGLPIALGGLVEVRERIKARRKP